MPTTTDGFTIRLARLKADLVEQGKRVQALVEGAFDAAFARDPAGAQRAIDMDAVVDKVDVQIERASVQLLTDATGAGAQLPEEQLRMVLTVVKVNNELERIADAGVSIAEEAGALLASNSSLPETFRVMTNSVIGILRDVCASFARDDAKLAKVVLASEDAVEEFKKAILRDAQSRVASGKTTVDLAFSQQEIATYCEIMANHCTNIAEQVIYSATGAIVRHMAGHWEQFELPA
jgi:phosphate transport system protein